MARPLVSDLRLFIKKFLYRNYKNEQENYYKREDVEEPYDEIIEQVDNTPPPEPPPPPPPENKRQNVKCG